MSEETSQTPQSLHFEDENINKLIKQNEAKPLAVLLMAMKYPELAHEDGTPAVEILLQKTRTNINRNSVNKKLYFST